MDVENVLDGDELAVAEYDGLGKVVDIFDGTHPQAVASAFFLLVGFEVGDCYLWMLGQLVAQPFQFSVQRRDAVFAHTNLLTCQTSSLFDGRCVTRERGKGIELSGTVVHRHLRMVL